MSPELSVLLVTYFFPPDSEVGAKRMARFCHYLPEFGIRPIVLTVRAEYAEKIDKSFAIPSGLRIERTSAGANPLSWYAGLKRHVPARATPEDKSKPAAASVPRRGYLRTNLLAALQTPDKFHSWYWPAVHAGAGLITRESVDLVFSSGPPWTSHLIARKLKKKYRIPWIADFRDAWVSDTWRQAVPRWRDRVDRRLEHGCVSAADLVVSTTDALRDTFIGNYTSLPREKFATITNGFDDAPIVPSTDEKSKGDKRILVHLGDLYAGRRIDTFCQAISDLLASGRLLPNSFKVLLIGNNDADIQKEAHLRVPELIRNGSIEFQAQVSWLDAQHALNNADVLLIFQGNHTLAVPAKTYEYAQTGKPILALVQTGALSNFLESTGSGFWASPADPRQIADRLMQALTSPRRSRAETDRSVGRYHFRNLSAQLARCMRELADKNE